MEIQDTRLMEREGQKDCQEEINLESVSSPETMLLLNCRVWVDFAPHRRLQWGWMLLPWRFKRKHNRTECEQREGSAFPSEKLYLTLGCVQVNSRPKWTLMFQDTAWPANKFVALQGQQLETTEFDSSLLCRCYCMVLWVLYADLILLAQFSKEGLCPGCSFLIFCDGNKKITTTRRITFSLVL